MLECKSKATPQLPPPSLPPGHPPGLPPAESPEEFLCNGKKEVSVAPKMPAATARLIRLDRTSIQMFGGLKFECWRKQKKFGKK